MKSTLYERLSKQIETDVSTVFDKSIKNTIVALNELKETCDIQIKEMEALLTSTNPDRGRTVSNGLIKNVFAIKKAFDKIVRLAPNR